jgi:hypothetical protein
MLVQHKEGQNNRGKANTRCDHRFGFVNPSVCVLHLCLDVVRVPLVSLMIKPLTLCVTTLGI